MESIDDIPSEAHGYGAGGDLSHAGGDNDGGSGVGAGEAGGEGEGDGEAIGNPDYDVSHDLARREMLLFVVIQQRGVRFTCHLSLWM